MNAIEIAIYARVSSEQQADANTIASQVAALRARVVADGQALLPEHEFLDEGYSGATLIRPALERLRDGIAAGEIERLYVHSPDRLSRKYAYQVLRLEEWQRAGVAVLFLNREMGASAEDALLLQVQGMVAEYERAKILERSRRGKRHAAQTGRVSVLSCAPYGYRFVGQHDSAAEVHLEIVEEQAQVVRQIFAWVGQDRATIGEVCRRLNASGEPTRTGKARWDRSVVCGMLKNPAYRGRAAYGKTRCGPLLPRLRAQRGKNLQPRKAYSISDVPADQWLSIPVPALVSEEVFAAVAEQLQHNRQHARQGQRGARYLLQGLIVCKSCGYAFYGKAVSVKAAKGQPRDYAYYRCLGTDAYRFGGERLCEATQVRTDLLDAAVWQQVCELLRDPARLEQEYLSRLQTPPSAREEELSRLEAQLRKVRQGVSRLIDSYAEGLIDKSEFEPRITRLRQRVAAYETQVQSYRAEAALQGDIRLIVGRLEEFAHQVQEGLAEADWQTRRQIIRTLVNRVEVEQEQVSVMFRIEPAPFALGPEEGLLPDCRRSKYSTLRRALLRGGDDAVFHDARLEPLFDQLPGREVANGLKQVVMIDVIKGSLDV